MKRFLVLLLLVLPLASAFEGWTFSGQFLVKEGFNFSLDINNNDLFVWNDNYRFVVSEGNCKEFVTFEFCFLEQNLNVSENYGLGYGMFVNGKLVPSIKVRLTRLSPNIKVDRIVSTTTPFIGEFVIVNVSISNVGNAPAENINFRETFQRFFVLESDANTLPRSVTKTIKKLNPGDSYNFYYKLKTSYYIVDSSTNRVTYEFNNEVVDVSLKPLILKVPSSFEVVIPKFAEKNVGEELNFPITIKNVDPLADLDFQIKILTPENLILECDGLPDGLVWNGIIEKSSNLVFDCVMKSYFQAEHNISIKYEAVINNKVFSDTISRIFRMKLKPLNVVMTVSNVNIDPLEYYNVSVFLENKNDFNFRNIMGFLESDAFLTQSFSKGLLVSGGNYSRVFNLKYPHPVSGKIPIVLHGIYTTEYGQKLNFSVSKTVNIAEFDKPFNIVFLQDKSSYEKGDSASVNVRIDKKSRINIARLRLLAGDEIFEENIEFSNNSISVFNFSRVLNDSIVLRVLVDYELDRKGLTDEFVHEIKIVQPTKEKVSAAVQDEKEKVGFLQRIVNWLDNIFA